MREDSPQPLPEDFDDRKPLAFGCVLFSVIIAILLGAFLLGAYSAWREATTDPNIPADEIIEEM